MYEAYPWQKEMHNSKAKIKFVQAGRRAGKTRSALQEVLRVIREASTKPVQFPGKKEKLTAEQAGLVPPIYMDGSSYTSANAASMERDASIHTFAYCS